MKEIECRLRELEAFMLSKEGRQSPEAVSELLGESFVEFGCSGRVYDRSQTLVAMSGEASVHWELSHYTVTLLAPDVALATFRAVKHLDQGKDKTESLRSSLWKNLDGRWKLVFHQGTLVEAAR